MDAGAALLYPGRRHPTGTFRIGSTMVKPSSACVFCGSGFGRDPAWRGAAVATGRILAEHGIEVIYGGGRVGLMGMVADAALAAGGRVTGIIPRHLARAEVEHGGLTELIETRTMSERKVAMIDRSDSFVVLPGGIGTLDELLEVVTLRQLGQHDKPTVMIDCGGYWQPLRALFEHIVAQEYARPDILGFMTWIAAPEDLPAALGL